MPSAPTSNSGDGQSRADGAKTAPDAHAEPVRLTREEIPERLVQRQSGLLPLRETMEYKDAKFCTYLYEHHLPAEPEAVTYEMAFVCPLFSPLFVRLKTRRDLSLVQKRAVWVTMYRQLLNELVSAEVDAATAPDAPSMAAG